MQKIKFGNILDLKSGIIVHGCNAQGVMGGGIAAQIRAKWPHVFEDYHYEYRQGKGLNLGDIIDTGIDPAQGLYVVSAITQHRYGNDGQKYVNYKAVHDAMEKIAQFAEDIGISVHYPLIGAGLAGGDWGVIQQCIDMAFEKHPTVDRTLWIYD